MYANNNQSGHAGDFTTPQQWEEAGIPLRLKASDIHTRETSKSCYSFLVLQTCLLLVTCLMNILIIMSLRINKPCQLVGCNWNNMFVTRGGQTWSVWGHIHWLSNIFDHRLAIHFVKLSQYQWTTEWRFAPLLCIWFWGNWDPVLYCAPYFDATSNTSEYSLNMPQLAQTTMLMAAFLVDIENSLVKLVIKPAAWIVVIFTLSSDWSCPHSRHLDNAGIAMLPDPSSLWRDWYPRLGQIMNHAELMNSRLISYWSTSFRAI